MPNDPYAPSWTHLGGLCKHKSLEIDIFGLKMTVKSDVEENNLKFNLHFQRYLLTFQANSAFSEQRKGHVLFQNISF